MSSHPLGSQQVGRCFDGVACSPDLCAALCHRGNPSLTEPHHRFWCASAAMLFGADEESWCRVKLESRGLTG